MNNKLIKYTTTIFVILMIFSLTQTFCTTKENEVIRFYHLVPTFITVGTSLIYVSSIYQKNIENNKKYGALLAACYFLTFHIIYSRYTMDIYQIIFLWCKEILLLFIIFATYFLFLVIGKNKDGFKLLKVTKISIFVIATFVAFSIFTDGIVTVKLGMYLYFASFVALTINTYLIKEESPKNTQKMLLAEPIDIEDSYMFAYYLEGLQKDTDIKSNLSVILNKEITHELIVGIFGHDPIRIEYSKIKKIILRYDTFKMIKEEKYEDRKVERRFILSLITKHLGNEAISEKISINLDAYDDLQTSQKFDMIITYEQKKEEKYIQLYSKTSPSLFIETLEKTLSFPIERER